jgi:hypothetical protein
MTADRMNTDDALQVISEMLSRTRRKTAVAGEFLIAWGLVIFLAIGLMWLLHELGQYRYVWINWLGAWLLGVAWSAWKIRRLDRRSEPASYSDRAVRGTWTALCPAFFLINLLIPLAYGSTQQLFAFDAVLTGCGLLITGILLQVRRFSGFALVWGIGAVAIAFIDFPYTLALFMAMIVFGALWPGWYLIQLARREN